MTSQPAPCPPLAEEQHGIVTAENVNSLSPSTFNTSNGTVVNITCYTSTYSLSGSSQVTCINGSWKPAPPVCLYKDKSPTPTTPNNETYLVVGKDAATDTVLIITAIICAAILVFLLSLLIYRLYVWRCKSKASNKHTDTSSPLPLYTTATGSTVLQSSWPGNPRAWTYLSVDRLLTDIERSRKENPKHSWRDFASISSYSNKRP